MKKALRIICVIIIIVIIFIGLTTVADYKSYQDACEVYEQTPEAGTLFDMCQKASWFSDSDDFLSKSKMYLDSYDVSEIQEYYDVDEEQAEEMFDAFLAEFLCKAILDEKITDDEIVNCFSRYKLGDFYTHWEKNVKHLNKKDKIKIADSLQCVMDSDGFYRAKEMVGIIRIDIYNSLNMVDSADKERDYLYHIGNEFFKEQDAYVYNRVLEAFKNDISGGNTDIYQDDQKMEQKWDYMISQERKYASENPEASYKYFIEKLTDSDRGLLILLRDDNSIVSVFYITNTSPFKEKAFIIDSFSVDNKTRISKDGNICVYNETSNNNYKYVLNKIILNKETNAFELTEILTFGFENGEFFKVENEAEQTISELEFKEFVELYYPMRLYGYETKTISRTYTQ